MNSPVQWETRSKAWPLLLRRFSAKMPKRIFRNTKRLLFLACGTSYYAALTARYWIEEVAGIPCDVEIASEYRYRVSVPDPQTLVVTISQSGETARYVGGSSSCS